MINKHHNVEDSSFHGPFVWQSSPSLYEHGLVITYLYKKIVQQTSHFRGFIFSWGLCVTVIIFIKIFLELTCFIWSTLFWRVSSFHWPFVWQIHITFIAIFLFMNMLFVIIQSTFSKKVARQTSHFRGFIFSWAICVTR